MPWRFRRSKKIAPGVRLNMGKRGMSLSFGGRGATVNVGRRGIRSTVGIPGSGISYTSKSGYGCLLLLLLPALILVISLACGGSSSATPTPTPKADVGVLLYDASSSQPSELSEPVAKENSRLRAGPGTEYDPVGRVPQGAVLTIVGRNESGDWLVVERPDGSQAWIAAFLVDNAPDLDSLPIVPAPSPPVSQQDVSAESAPSTPPRTNPNAFTCIGGCAEPPDPSCVIKGNVNPSTGTKIYHTPASRWYDRTDIKPEEGDRWFCTEAEAEAAGFRPPER